MPYKRCQFEFTGEKQAERFVFRCKFCKREATGKSQSVSPKATCKHQGEPEPIRLRLAPPPLPITEIERRISICRGCEHWNAEKEGCKVCGTCGSGQKMYNGLMRDPAKRCPAPGGSKWGPPLPAPLRVAFLSPALMLGGAERWLASLSRHFDPAKVWTQAIVLANTKDVSPIVAGWLPKHIRIVGTDSLPTVMSQVDVLIAWGMADLPGLTKGAKCRVVEVQHGTMGFGTYQEALVNAAIKSGAELTAVGEACLDNFPPELRSSVTVIENGAETDRLQPIEGRETTREKLGILPGEKVCLFIGRIAAVKNLDTLVKAVALLPGWRLVIAGPRYHPIDLGDAIVLPAQEHLGDLFAAADVFCAPSHHEANSLGVQEAMLGELPVVTTAYPAAMKMHEQHGEITTLVPLNPLPEVLAAAIADAGYMPRSRRAKEIALANWTAEKMTGRWTEYLLKLTKPVRL